MPMIYDISDSTFTFRKPDDVDWDNLQAGDLVGRYMISWMRPLEVNGQIFQYPHEERIFYTASIQVDNKFRVYWAYGERNDVQSTARNGYKLRDERVARLLFPDLDAYEFIYQ